MVLCAGISMDSELEMKNERPFEQELNNSGNVVSGCCPDNLASILSVSVSWESILEFSELPFERKM